MLDRYLLISCKRFPLLSFMRQHVHIANGCWAVISIIYMYKPVCINLFELSYIVVYVLIRDIADDQILIRYHMYSCIDIRYLVNSRVDRDHLHQCLCMLVKNSMYTGMYRYWSEISKTQLLANEYWCPVHICFDINQRYL